LDRHVQDLGIVVLDLAKEVDRLTAELERLQAEELQGRG